VTSGGATAGRAAAANARDELLARHDVGVVGSAGSDRTLVFVHGFGTDQAMWKGFVSAFAADWRIVLLDNAGAGNADPTAFVQSRYLNLRQYALDLVEVLDALGVRGAAVVGHSAGAMIALLASLERPDVVSKLVLVAASPRYLDSDGYRGGFTDADLQQTYSAVLASFDEWVDGFTPAAMNTPDRPELAQHFADALRRIPPQRALTVLCSILQSDYRAEVARVTVPTLLVHGREDFFVPDEVARYLNERIPGSRLVTVNARGHFPHLVAPEEVVAAIRGFL